MGTKEVMPKENEAITFTHSFRTFEAPWLIYLDFKAFPVEAYNTSQNKAVKTHIHKPCSFCLNRNMFR